MGGKVIHWDQCKQLDFEYTGKWYIYRQEYVLENEIHIILLRFCDKKLILDFEIKIDHLNIRPSF